MATSFHHQNCHLFLPSTPVWTTECPPASPKLPVSNWVALRKLEGGMDIEIVTNPSSGVPTSICHHYTCSQFCQGSFQT